MIQVFRKALHKSRLCVSSNFTVYVSMQQIKCSIKTVTVSFNAGGAFLLCDQNSGED